MPYRYSAFGLSIEADSAIPGLVAVAGSDSVDTRIWLEGASTCASPDCDSAPWYVTEAEHGEQPALRAWRLQDGRFFRLLYLDGTEFVIDRAGANVWAGWTESSTLADTATYLLGPVLGFVLRLRGTTCLHGSAVSVGSAAIALVGPQGAGKSTMAAAFSQLRYSVLADDVLPVFRRAGSWWVHPAYPQLRLWPDAVASLCGTPNALPPLTPTWDKRAMDLTGSSFEHRALPLAAIYVLGGASAGTRAVVEEVKGRAVLMALLGNTYVSYLLEHEMRAPEFEDLAELVTRVPVRRITRPQDLSRLPDVCEAILADYESLACTA